MTEVNVTWIQGKQFIGTDSTNHSVVISSPDEGIGMRPSDLLLVSLGSCTAFDVVNILTKKRAHITDIRITVSGERAEEYPKAFVKIHVHYAIGGYNIKPADVEKAIQLSEEKYCSVSATVGKSATITTDFEVFEAEHPAAES